MSPVTQRLGYTTSPAVYLPAASANGMTISIEVGSASVFVGEPFAPSHSYLATVSAGHSYEVSGLDDGEVLSVQADDSFGYRLTRADPTDPPDARAAPDAGAAPDASAPDASAPDAAAPDAGPSAEPALSSQIVTWTCTGSPCPWGSSASNPAIVWPAAAGAIATRLGYTVSAGIYLPAARANGAAIAIESGTANAFAGAPGDGAHRWLGTIAAGQTFHVTGLASREVLSVQADADFTYRATLAPTTPDPDPPPDVIQSTQALWRCNTPGCASADWTGAVIHWPAWAAYQTNARAGEMSRSVFSVDGAPLHAYMGAWAEGCEVTAESGTVLIVEWQRGTDAWREIWLYPGQSHVIHLVSPENGALIESYEGSPGFSASLRNCTPQPISP